MHHDLDLTHSPRRATFEFYRGFDSPYFNVCTRVDVTALKPALVAARVGSVSLACHYLALRLADRIEPFRHRLREGRVRVYDVVHASTTVLRADDSFGFALLEYDADFARFATRGQVALQAAKAADAGFAPRVDDQALLHFTTLPWVHFTSFSHARNWGREDSIPKFAFGRIDADTDGDRRWMPLGLEVHHALMDGVHVGRFMQAFEAAMLDPLPWLQGGALP